MNDIKQMEKDLKEKIEEKTMIEGKLKEIKPQYDKLKEPEATLTHQLQSLKKVITQTGGDDSDLKLLEKRLQTIHKKTKAFNAEQTALTNQFEKLGKEIPDLSLKIKLVKYLDLNSKIWELRNKAINDWKPLTKSESETLIRLKGELSSIKKHFAIHNNVVEGIDRGTYPH